MSTVGSDSRSGSSDGGTLESIPHKESSATKPRPDPGRGVDKSDPTERVITENESEAPHAKRQRVTRHHGHNPLMYNARYHPADDFLRPANAAKLKGKSRTHHPVQDGDTTEESASNTEDGGNEGDFHGSQETDLDVVNSDGTALRSASPQVPNLECRRSSRTISRSEAPNYDMR